MKHARDFSGTTWDTDQYLKFSDYRLRPALELLQHIPVKQPALIYDAGCGTGRVTLHLAERWPNARILGVDNSTEMLDKARSHLPSIEWRLQDVETWNPADKPDIIFANASLHWMKDHHKLFPRLLSLLETGGCLAVQMPLSWHTPSHVLMRETLQEGGRDGAPLGSDALRQALAASWVLDAASYYRMLAPLSKRVDIWETTYIHQLSGDDAVYEWVKGTGMRPVLKDLSLEELEIFGAAYRRRLEKTYPKQEDGITLYPFPRLFIVAIA